MSYLFSRMARAPVRTSFSATRRSRLAVSSFSTSTLRAALNESDRAHGQDREDHLAEHYEKAKEEQLQDQKDGQGKWKRELGSESEQAIKADRGEVEAGKDTIAKMQKETAQAAEAKRK